MFPAIKDYENTPLTVGLKILKYRYSLQRKEVFIKTVLYFRAKLEIQMMLLFTT
jgi:hypothetical protein